MKLSVLDQSPIRKGGTAADAVHETIELAKERWTVPSQYAFGDESLVPFRANETIDWKLA